MKNNLFPIKSFLVFAFLSTLVAVVPVSAKPFEWLRKLKRVEIMRSTRAEVERLFDNPQVSETRDLAVNFKNGWGKEVTYETKYGKLEVWYGSGKCSESKGPYAYDVAADIAMMLTLYPNDVVFENQLGYDLGKFGKESDSETDTTYSLETEKSKIAIETNNSQVSSIEFGISEKYKTQLECKNVKVKEPLWMGKLRTLEIFRSTRSDVEILFENPRVLEIEDSVKDGDDWAIDVEYETMDGELRAKYSTGGCFERQSRKGYDAAKDTLVELRFIPTEKVDVTEINLDLRKSDELSDRLGISVGKSSGKLQYIEFSPNEKQEELDCEKVLNLQK